MLPKQIKFSNQYPSNSCPLVYQARRKCFTFYKFTVVNVYHVPLIELKINASTAIDMLIPFDEDQKLTPGYKTDRYTANIPNWLTCLTRETF